MKTVSIDLAEKSPCCEPEPLDSKKVWYPTIHLEGKSLAGLPKSGVLKIKFKKVRSEKTEKEDGTTRYSCTLEVQKIVGVEGKREEADVPDRQASEQALDLLAKAMMAKGGDSEEDDYED